MKIHSKQYIAACRIPSVRCDCGSVATFYQSKKDNVNNNVYFFGCPNWRTQKCNFFSWCHEYKTICDIQIFRRLILPSSSENQIKPEQSHKRALDQDDHEELKELQCVICFSGERSHLITPCNHLCCCSTCARQIHEQCPICRGHIGSIQRIFLV